MDLERDILDFLGSESAILYSQDFSTISSVIHRRRRPWYQLCDSERDSDFSVHCAVVWHNDLKSLEQVLVAVEKERKQKRGPLTKRFIIREGIFQKDSVMIDLPKLVRKFSFLNLRIFQIALEYQDKYRLILDESFSFGTVGEDLLSCKTFPFVFLILLSTQPSFNSHDAGGESRHAYW